MCGITGLVDYANGVSRSILTEFNNRLIHRGPDAQHVFLSRDNTAGLGHCRLSILDTSSAADQPFRSRDSRYWLTFNGEIYNYLELRAELEKLGHHFITSSDTEVLLASYVQWGKECLHRFNGMWAFAIWDEARQELFASRDRFGVKSLYFSLQKQRLCFASEQKALFVFRDQGIGHICPQNTGWILMYPESIESKRETLYQGIEKLLPGEYLLFDKSGIRIHEWWNTHEELERQPNQAVDANALTQLFEQACHLRTRSDVKIATSLSGGLDSSAVTSQIALFPEALEQRELKSFVGSFVGSDKDEYQWAKQVVDQYHIPHRRIPISAESAVQHLIDATLALEDITSLPVLGPWFVYQAMRDEGYKVSIEGHAGDELLGGYTRHLNVFIADLINRKSDPAALASAIIALNDSIGGDNLQRLKGNLLQLSLDPASTNLNIINEKPYLSQLLNISCGIRDHKIKERRNPLFNQRNMLFQRLYEDFHYYALPSILKTYDRLSMANSVEIRSPFLDYRFALAAFSAPEKFKIHNGKSKNLLREYFKFIPNEIRARNDKKGFTQPLGNWLGGAIGQWLLAFIQRPEFVQSALYDGKALRKILSKLIAEGKYQQVITYWPLVNLAILEQYQS